MAKAYFKLNDRGASYYDAGQRTGIVSDRVVELEITDHVRNAERSRQIVKVTDKQEIKESADKQKAEQDAIDQRAAGITAKESTNPSAKEIAEAIVSHVQTLSESAGTTKAQATNGGDSAADEQKKADLAAKQEARTALEVSYKEVTGKDVVATQTDDDLTAAITKANADKGSETGKKGLADLDKESK